MTFNIDLWRSRTHTPIHMHVCTHKSNFLVEHFEYEIFLWVLMVDKVLDYVYEVCMSVCTCEHSTCVKCEWGTIHSLWNLHRQTSLAGAIGLDHKNLQSRKLRTSWGRDVLLQFQWFCEAVEMVGCVRVLSALATVCEIFKPVEKHSPWTRGWKLSLLSALLSDLRWFLFRP